jgi:cell division septation protein DedD
MTDKGLHEVQLAGKQLVFLFMVGTVIAVVIFLSGVMTGRGLRTPAATELAATSSTSTIDPTADVEPPPAASSTPSDDTPVSAQESLTYAERLGSPTPLPDDLREPEPAPRPATTPAVPAPAAKPAPVMPAPVTPAPPTRRPEPAVAAAPLAEPPGKGFVVQVMAVNSRAEADTIARRLLSKGYPTFVTTTGAGTQKVSYRVRVGKYETQREADAVSARLQKEEQFKPWVTR